MPAATAVKCVYTYFYSAGLEIHQVERSSKESIIIPHGLSGEVVRRRDLDQPESRYFTKPALAIGAFIAKAEAALSKPQKRRGDHAGWREALTKARAALVAHT